MIGRRLRQIALVLALVLTVPIVLVGAVASGVVALSEHWIRLVGRLGESVGWRRRR